MPVSCREKGPPFATKICSFFLFPKTQLETCQNECPNAASCATVYQGAASNSTVVCNCKEGWTGGHCEKKVVIPEEKSTGGLVAAVIIVSIIAAVALIAVGGLVYLMKRR